MAIDRRILKEYAEIAIPADLATPSIAAAMSKMNATADALDAARDALAQVESEPAEHAEAVRARRKVAPFDAIAHGVRLTDADAAVVAADAAATRARLDYAAALYADRDAIAGPLADRTVAANAAFAAAVDAMRATFDEYAALYRLASFFDRDGTRWPPVDRDTVLYSGPIQVGRVTDALAILAAAADKQSVPTARREAVQVSARLK